MLIPKLTLTAGLIAIGMAGCDGGASSGGPGATTGAGESTSLLGNLPAGATQLETCPLEMTEMGAAYLESMADPETGWEFVRFELVNASTPEEDWEITQVHNGKEGDAYWRGSDYTMLVPEDQIEAMSKIKLHYGGSFGTGRGFIILGRDEDPPTDTN